jgi:hypothetical protein
MSSENFSFSVPGYTQLWAFHKNFYAKDGIVRIEYLGVPEELIAAGIATALMLTINGAKGPRAKRLDQDGCRFFLSRRWRTTDSNGQVCQPYQWFSITRSRPLAKIEELPWGHEAMAAAVRWGHEAMAAAVRYREARSMDPEDNPQLPVPPPRLRLVVDNTR